MYLFWEYFSQQVNADDNQPLGWRRYILLWRWYFKPHSIFTPVSEKIALEP